MNDTPAAQPATLPAAAIQAAAEVQARYFSGGANPVPDAEDLHLARMMLEAAAPHLGAAERERCMPLTAERVNELEQLAADMLSRFVRTDSGCRARVGQVQISKWEAVLARGQS